MSEYPLEYPAVEALAANRDLYRSRADIQVNGIDGEVFVYRSSDAPADDPFVCLRVCGVTFRDQLSVIQLLGAAIHEVTDNFEPGES